MLAHFRRPLQTLTFSSLPMTERTMVGYLSYLPTITSLHVYGTSAVQEYEYIWQEWLS